MKTQPIMCSGFNRQDSKTDATELRYNLLNSFACKVVYWVVYV